MTAPVHAVCETACANEECAVCHAQPGHPCDAVHAVHVARISRAAHDGHITMRDAAAVFAGAGVFTGASLVLDGVTG